MISLLIVLVLVVLCLFCTISIYNKGITLRNYVKEAFSTMDVYMKKRWDLIPNLVEAVKGYTEHEKGVLEKITELRNQNYSSMTPEDKMKINADLSMGLSKLIAVAENYPDLKANQNFSKLMDELSAVEKDIANSRKYYNGTVRELNTFTELFPSNIVASCFGIKAEKMFEIDEEQRENVQVKF